MANSDLMPLEIGGKKYRSVKEGLATILAPYRENRPSAAKKARNNDEGDQAVFYNPIQQFNRDLSVLAILVYGEGAVADKETRLAKKLHGRQRGKVRNNKQMNEAQKLSKEDNPTSVESSVATNLKKRKVDELEVEQEVGPGDAVAKKAKVDDFDADEEELKIMQLEAGNVNLSGADGQNGGAQKPVGPPQHHASSDTKLKPVPFAILDALSATGLRALRYAKEIPFATKVIANDLSSEAVKSIDLNIEHNNLSSTVFSNVGDARAYMYSKIGNEHHYPAPSYVHRFDVIDLDPYGTAAPFFDSSLQALADGGLLCVTCTDAGVFASNGYPEKAFALYGGTTVKGPHCHEGGLRLILHAIATSAAKYGIAIEPLLSLSIDFYARLFIRVHKQQAQVKLLAGTTMSVYSCDHGCGAWSTQLLARNQTQKDRVGDTMYKHSYSQGPTTTPNCEHCGSKTHLGGPLWAGPLHNPYFVQRILDRLPTLNTSTYATTDRLRGMLTTALEEDLTLSTTNTPSTPSDTSDQLSTNPALIPRLPPQTIDLAPFFFIPSTFAKVVHTSTPPEDALRGAIRHLGYRVTRSHCKPGSFKTNAPFSILWEIMREWVRQRSPIKEGKVREGTPGHRILARMRGTERNFANDIKDNLKLALDKADSLEDLKNLLRSGLYRAENERMPAATEGTAPGPESTEPTRTEQDNEEAATGADDRAVAVREEISRPAPPSVTSAPSKLKIIFDEKLGKEKQRGKLVRYQINPRANWGPMNRAAGG